MLLNLNSEKLIITSSLINVVYIFYKPEESKSTYKLYIKFWNNFKCEKVSSNLPFRKRILVSPFLAYEVVYTIQT